jgi:butyryl-CoA dehydrogenase
MLLAQKAYVEGGLSLCLYGSSLLDEAHTNPDAKLASDALSLLDLLTPIIKSWCSEYGPKANDLAIQVLGGAGYTREYPVEQYWRDNRLNPIHEGTNGIQALDLMGRKVWQKNSQGLILLNQAIMQDIARAEHDDRVNAWASSLKEALQKVQTVTQQLAGDMQKTSTDQVLANATCYLNMLSKVVVSWLWLKQALAAKKGLSKLSENSTSDQESKDFYEGKLQAAQYFFHWELPLMYHDAQLLIDRDNTNFEMRDACF